MKRRQLICRGRLEGNPITGYEMVGYVLHKKIVTECHPDVDCGGCIINGGCLSPVTGKKFKGNRSLYVNPKWEE